MLENIKNAGFFSMANILVIEDDAMNCKLFDLILSRMGGHKVIIAHDAENAIRCATSGVIDLIIMDVSLQNWSYEGAEANGIDLTRRIRASEKSKNIPVLLATAHAMKEDRENLLSESGADDYFSKPIVDHFEFLSKVATMLSEKNLPVKVSDERY